MIPFAALSSALLRVGGHLRPSRPAWLALLLLPALAGAAETTPPAPEKLPMPRPMVGIAPQPVDQVTRELGALNRFIGGYPPRFASADERRDAYRKWSALAQQVWLIEARAPAAEVTLFLLGELYRQGHNLDVAGAAPRADAALSACITRYPEAVPCHFAASYFYLSVHPKHAPKGEASLLRLRELRKPDVDPEIERGLVFAYLYQGRKQEALKQIDYVLTLTPGAEWALKFRKALLEDGITLNQR